MQKSILPLLLIFLLSKNLAAQVADPQKMDLQPCGTPAYLDPDLLKYLAEPALAAAERGNSDTLFVALKIHLLASDAGSGRFSPDKFLAAFCRLQQDFAPTKIQFYMKDDWNLLNKTAWFNHQDIPTGIEMMLTNNVPDAANCYFVSNPAGNCGYNLPYGGVAIGHSCASASDHTWAHELGHQFTLPHPFIGWEGKTYNFNNPTPTKLTYDYTHFHAQPEPVVPAPLDTALVEFLDKSNCTAAADKFCDTKPDYLSYRWDCNAQNQSTVKQKDPAGAEFFSDGTLFMSYAFDKCQSRFSDDEIAAMRANLLNVKSSYLKPTAPAQPIFGKTTLVEPVAGMPVSKSGATFHWTAVPNAEKYVVQGSRLPNFPFKDFEAVVSGTVFNSAAFPTTGKMYWRVKPFNSMYACAEFSDLGDFQIQTVSTDDFEKLKVKIYPNLLAAGEPVFVDFGENVSQKLTARLFNSQGQLVREISQTVENQTFELKNLTQNLAAGAYRLLLISKEKLSSQTIVVY